MRLRSVVGTMVAATDLVGYIHLFTTRGDDWVSLAPGSVCLVIVADPHEPRYLVVTSCGRRGWVWQEFTRIVAP